MINLRPTGPAYRDTGFNPWTNGTLQRPTGPAHGGDVGFNPHRQPVDTTGMTARTPMQRKVFAQQSPIAIAMMHRFFGGR